VGGFLISSYSLFMFQRIDALTGNAELVNVQIWRGIGIALILAPVNTAGLNAVRRDDVGYASWMLNWMQRYGGAFAVAILSLFLERWTATQRELLGASRAMLERPGRELVQRAVSLGLEKHEATAAVRGALRGQLANAASTVAYQDLFLACAVFALLGVVPALFLVGRQRRSRAG
jgi:DHA2 family multidrug resistance protein